MPYPRSWRDSFGAPPHRHCYMLGHVFREVMGKSDDLTQLSNNDMFSCSQHENSYCKDTCQEGSHALSDKPSLPPALSLNFKFYPIKYLFLSAKSRLSRDIFKNRCLERLLYALAPRCQGPQKVHRLEKQGLYVFSQVVLQGGPQVPY